MKPSSFYKDKAIATLFLSAVAVVLVESSVAFSLEEPARDKEGISMKGDIRTLVSKIEDLGGKVQDLQVKETATEIRIELAADVLFDFDKADILPKAQAALKQAANVIREKAKGAVRIEGHTDGKGLDSYNQKLSERRANAVKEWLVSKEGLKNLTFAARGFGAKQPVASNTKPDGSDDPDGRRKNRRVEITIKKK